MSAPAITTLALFPAREQDHEATAYEAVELGEAFVVLRHHGDGTSCQSGCEFHAAAGAIRYAAGRAGWQL